MSAVVEYLENQEKLQDEKMKQIDILSGDFDWICLNLS